MMQTNMQNHYITHCNDDIYKLVIEKKVAKKVAFLKNKKKITRQNFMDNHVHIFSEMYGLSRNEVELLFESEIDRQDQQNVRSFKEKFFNLGSASQNLLSLGIILMGIAMSICMLLGNSY